MEKAFELEGDFTKIIQKLLRTTNPSKTQRNFVRDFKEKHFQNM